MSMLILGKFSPILSPLSSSNLFFGMSHKEAFCDISKRSFIGFFVKIDLSAIFSFKLAKVSNLIFLFQYFPIAKHKLNFDPKSI